MKGEVKNAIIHCDVPEFMKKTLLVKMLSALKNINLY